MVVIMEDSQVPWSRIAGFIRQHTHDVRNDLNSLELESTLLQEVVPDGEAKAGVARIRKQLRSLTDQMRSLSARFQSSTPFAAPMPAKALLTIWKERCAAIKNAPEVQWSDELSEEKISVDVEMMANVIQELLSNATAFPQGGPIAVSAKADNRLVTFEMKETKPKGTALDTRPWGQPFFSTRRGSYGLGVFTARRLVEANHGTFTQHFEPAASVLITRILLPKAA